jgi:FkbM family methyltransferase
MSPMLAKHMIANDLIFDVGCNNGDDTDFYLRKGFKVVAIDADQSLCEQVAERFAAEITSRRCEVVHGAVGETTGDTVAFYICDRPDWNTCDPYFVERNQKAGATFRTVSVPTVNVADLMESRGTPYYLKIDVEGADVVPLRTIAGRHAIPTYVSIEIAQHDLSEGLEQIRLLHSLGYTRFNFFNQGMRRSVKAPYPPLEGEYVPFDGGAVTTGLFGKELGGMWMDFSAAEKRFTGIHRRYVLFRDHRLYSKGGAFGGTLLSKVHNRFRRHVLGDPVAWYELHAGRE